MQNEVVMVVDTAYWFYSYNILFIYLSMIDMILRI